MEQKSKLVVLVMFETTEYWSRSLEINEHFLGKCEPGLWISRGFGLGTLPLCRSGPVSLLLSHEHWPLPGQVQLFRGYSVIQGLFINCHKDLSLPIYELETAYWKLHDHFQSLDGWSGPFFALKEPLRQNILIFIQSLYLMGLTLLDGLVIVLGVLLMHNKQIKWIGNIKKVNLSWRIQPEKGFEYSLM